MIVVISGIGGLTAAALLAHAGRRVLVVERHDPVGGYAHAFRRGRYLVDRRAPRRRLRAARSRAAA